jgi:hypothetical protein
MVGSGVAWLVKHGFDTATATSLATTAVAFVMAAMAAGWGVYAKRNAGLAIAAASVPGNIVITDHETALATPALPNVISRDDMKVIPK